MSLLEKQSPPMVFFAWAAIIIPIGCTPLFDPAVPSRGGAVPALFTCDYTAVGCEGRRDLEVRPDGTFALWEDVRAIGITDAHGTWSPDGDGCVSLVYAKAECTQHVSQNVSAISDKEAATLQEICEVDPAACATGHRFPTRLCTRADAFTLELSSELLVPVDRVPTSSRRTRPESSSMRDFNHCVLR